MVQRSGSPLPEPPVHGVFGGEAQMGAVGAFIDVTQQPAAQVGAQHDVAEPHDAATAEGSGEQLWLPDRDHAARCADPPSLTKAGEFLIQPASERTQRSTGWNGQLAGSGGMM